MLDHPGSTISVAVVKVVGVEAVAAVVAAVVISEVLCL
jgi:hypothetical protein